MKKQLIRKIAAAAMAFPLAGAAVIAPVDKNIFTGSFFIAFAETSTASFDESTGVLTLHGNVVNEDVRAWYQNNNVKKVVCEEGTIFPEDCRYMFEDFWAEDIDLSNADTSKVTNMEGMFNGCHAECIDFSGIDTSNVTDMSGMFHICENLESLDLSNFNTSNVTNMCNMFSGCSKLESLDINGILGDIKSCTVNMDGMFSGCTALEDDICTAGGISVTLDSRIGVNIYLTACENLAKVVMSGPDGDIVYNDISAVEFIEIPIDEGSEKAYRFTYPVNAAQSNEVITIRAYDKDNRQLIIYKAKDQISDKSQISCTVRDYLQNLKKNDSKKISLQYGMNKFAGYAVNAFENYLDAADNYFNGTDNTIKDIYSYIDNAINDINSYIDSIVSNNSLTENYGNVNFNLLKKKLSSVYSPVETFKPDFSDDIKLSLVLNSTTSLRIYTDSNDVKLYGCDLVQKISEYGKYYEISNISADKLCDKFTITIDGVDYEISPMSYVYRVLSNGNASQKLKDMANATYAYAVISKIYSLVKPIEVLTVPVYHTEETNGNPDIEIEEWDSDEDDYKKLTEDDIVYDEENDVTYAKNQLIVGAMLGTNRSVMEKMAAYHNAQIVGYFDEMEHYQFEFTEDKTYSELEELAERIEGYSFITYAIPNYVEATVPCYYPQDTKIKESWGYGGRVWGQEALNLPNAWNHLQELGNKVKIGIIDEGFENYDDLTFEKIIADIFEKAPNHGTAVAGIIAAGFDNDKGIAGVATNVELYANCKDGNSLFDYNHEIKQYKDLIKKYNVRAINISLGNDDEYLYKASTGDQKYIKKIENEAKALSNDLKTMILNGYDFLIVQAAGNRSDMWFDKDFNPVSEIDPNKKYYLEEQDAQYANDTTAITDPLLKDRIIVVGAATIDFDNDNGNDKYYRVWDHSGRGSRVDVYAPGGLIYSRVSSNSYDFQSGTSLATPFITGIAALMWQANPLLTATQVKNIIVNSKGTNVIDLKHPSLALYMPDAEECVKLALSSPDGISAVDNDMPKGTLKGKVVDENSNALANISLYFVRTSTGQANLKDYYYTTTTDDNGEYEFTVPAGEYELILCDKTTYYLPMRVKNITIEPDNVEFFENIILEYMNDFFCFGQATISGAVYDAINGNAINGAEIRIRDGWNNTNGRYCLQQTETDSSGQFELTVDFLGNYTVEVKSDGYITGYYNVVAVLEGVSVIKPMILTPVLPEDEYRVILTWDDNPRDLDSHLTYYLGTDKKMHVYYSSPKGTADGIHTLAQLDIDNTHGYGPETITMTITSKELESNGAFYYSVYKFYGNEALKQSNAIVRLYSGNTLLYTYYVPNKDGNLWRVFKITKDGITKIDSIETVTSTFNVR